jgi:hypothetical protein
VNEDLHAGQWIVSQLESHTSLQVYRDMIPPDAPLPAIRFHVQTANDNRGSTSPSDRIVTVLDWLIVVVNQGVSVAKLVPIADQIDQAMQGAHGQSQDGAVLILGCTRLEPFSLIEADRYSGVQYRHAGGLYRTIVQPA